MQILAIAIYKGDERRVVRFKPGQLNVLPGWSKTGKSSLLEITEYCLGRTTPTYPGGELEVVTWFGLLADFDGLKVFFGRPAATAETATSAMYLEGVEDVPDASALRPNSDTRQVRRQVGRLLGIPEDEIRPGEPTRPRATSGQALLFCFQRYTEIANANQLFHRTDEPDIPRALRDAFPFFLGAAGIDYLARQDELRELRRTLRQVDRELTESQHEASEVNVRAAALLAEAGAAGLIPTRTSVTLGEADALRLLRTAVELPTASSGDPDTSQDARLRAELRELSLELRRLREQRSSLYTVRQERYEFGDEVREQRGRLRSLGLLRRVDDTATCPVCAQGLPEADATTIVLQASLRKLDDRLAGVRALEPERRRMVNELRHSIGQARARIRAIQGSLDRLSADERVLAGLQATERQAYVRGRISQFLEAFAPTRAVQLKMLEERADELTAAIARLEDELDPSSVANRLAASLSYINEMISQSSEELALEYQRMRLDPGALTVYAIRRQGELPLARIGSSANAVGYHLATHAALHRWFIEENRPVPRFLFLDQPEQVYFPEHARADSRDLTDEFSDEDWGRVRRLYGFLHRVTEDLDGQMQIIVVGHARLDELEWFNDALVEDWKREGAGLVPREWFESIRE